MTPSEHAAPVAIVGAAERANSVVLVTVATDGRLLDRRDVVLTDAGLPTHPHHHEGSWAVGRYLDTPGARRLTLAEAVALVEQVRVSAAQGATAALDALSRVVPVPIAGIALRACPELPPTTEQRILDHRAQTFADSAMYREALAAAARGRGWAVSWYQPERVAENAARHAGVDGLASRLQAMGRACGPPWQARHKLAATAALAALAEHGVSSSAESDRHS